ncbi:hypothetical protein QJQ45_004832 [Haematococcus lacustris]|nr:hypothetical protein QJQ45_004832 [Haematococcus lacustris]
MGTTIMCVSYKGGVILGADSRTSTGSYIANRTTDKITPLADNVYILRSGSAADTQAVASYVQLYIAQSQAENNAPITVRAAAHMAMQMAYGNKDMLQAGLIVGGWDKEEGPAVWAIPLGGTLVSGPTAATATTDTGADMEASSAYIYGFCDKYFRPDMSEAEAKDFVVRAVGHAMARDASSGGCIRTVTIDANGARRDFCPNPQGQAAYWLTAAETAASAPAGVLCFYRCRWSTGNDGGKAAAERKKVEKAEKRGQKAAVMTAPDPDDPLAAKYGDAGLVASQAVSGRVWTRVEDLNASFSDKEVLLRGRVHTVRGKGKSAFIVLRQRTATLQVCLFANDTTVSKGMVKYASQITRESIVDVEGVITLPSKPVEGCSQSDVELQCRGIRVISRAAVLPFEVTDAARSEADVQAAAEKGEVLVTVGQDTRLNNRFLDLRTPANQAIFKLQSAVCQLFKDYLLSQGFQEIHSPKLIAGASEGGASVFKLDYMGTPACLAQSPQLYKQMAITADCERVFEVGPVFRAENSNTHRHLCEFMGLDFEMAINEHYCEVMEVVEGVFEHIFTGLATRHSRELAVVGQQFPFSMPEFKRLRLTFAEGIKMLQEGGYPDVDPVGDLSTEIERALGKLVKEKYGTDFYILHRYPLAVRPFYTMPCIDDPIYSNSFDVFIRGEEIISGAQRVHDADLLTERAAACGVPVDSIASYIDAFRLGAPPHGGAGVGLERVVMLYLGLDNIRKTSMFPRDPKRLTP